MDEEEINAHWEYTKKILLAMIDVVEVAYKEALKHGAKYEKEKIKKIIEGNR